MLTPLRLIQNEIRTIPLPQKRAATYSTRALAVLLAIGLLCLISGCGEAELPEVDAASVTAASVKTHFDALPANNVQPDTAQVALGKQLFWDPILSGNRDVACASCHHPQHGWGDGLFAAQGVGATGLGPTRAGGVQLPRNSQTLINVAFNGIGKDGTMDALQSPMFWDNRANSLEEQALEPLRSEGEMRGTNLSEQEIDAEIEARLSAIPEYESNFLATFGPRAGSPVTINRVAQALAAFQRSLIAVNSPFDRFMRGDEEALTDIQRIGMQNFIDAGCADCHNGPMFSDFKVHVISAPDHPLNPEVPDTGVNETFAFRTPTLRNLNETAPYMHSGIFPTLAHVMGFYEDLEEDGAQNAAVPRGTLDPLVANVRGVEDGQAAILSFLESLNDTQVDRSVPQAVPSGLPPGGAN